MNDVASSLRLERRIDGCALLVVDVPGEAVNTLSGAFATDLSRVLDEVERDDSIVAVVVVSGKQDGFIAGADLKLLSTLTSADQARELSRSGQRSLERVQRSRKPFVAAIHGACLGGGLEVALACQARVASSDERTKLGLPEVQLGLLPGLGGTQRLPRLVGVQVALDLMLTGRQLDARRALRAGLVDEVVPQAILLDVAARFALDRVAGAAKPKKKFARGAVMEALLVKNPLGRKVFFNQARKKTLEKTHGNYPAAERILEVMRIGLSRGMQAGLGAEAKAFGELVVSGEARELMGIFFAQQELKKDRGITDPTVEARKVRRVAVLGAGLMGAGVAYVTAVTAKLPVRLKDRDDRS